tara:strand:- start:304 stop:480 length:177 start_codon:yes stop_codon:yes gene_type:complete
MQVTNPTYVLSKEGKVIMEVTATSVERAQDYFYDTMPESYSFGYMVYPKPIETPKGLS